MVGDNGIRGGEENDDSTNDLGVKLVNMLLNQLEGQMEIMEGEGNFYRIIFRELGYEPRI
jgi:two-component sensor histidine kinase